MEGSPGWAYDYYGEVNPTPVEASFSEESAAPYPDLEMSNPASSMGRYASIGDPGGTIDPALLTRRDISSNISAIDKPNQRL